MSHNLIVGGLMWTIGYRRSNRWKANMWAIAAEVLRWVGIAFVGAQALAFIGGIGWMIWNDAIQPRLIPRRHIDEVADQITCEFADPEWEAFLRHDQAWHDSDGAAQTHWLRVRKAIRRKLGRHDQLGDDAGR